MIRILIAIWFLMFSTAVSHAEDAVSSGSPAGTPTESLAGAEFAKNVQPFLKQHCYSCHGEQKQKSHIRFDQIKAYGNGDVQLWTQVHEVLSLGEMPPEDKPRPSKAETNQILSWIEREQLASGDGITRRLNRRELSASLQDLTGLTVRYADGLPEDGKLAGFDTGAAALQDAADSVTQIMAVTRRAVAGIRFLDPPSSKIYKANLRQVMVEYGSKPEKERRKAKDARKVLEEWKSLGIYTKVRDHPVIDQGLFLEPRWLGDKGGLEFGIPIDQNKGGVLRLRLVVSVAKNYPNIPNPNLWVRVGGKYIDHVEINSSLDKPQELIYQIQTDDLAVGSRGLSVMISNRVEMPYGVEGFENENKTKPEENVPNDGGLYRPLYDKKKTPLEKKPVPYVVLQDIEIETGYVASWPPRKWKADVGEISDHLDTAKKLLALWTQRAWRRPATTAEQERFISLYKNLRGQDLSFDDALRATFQSVLLSGPFRFLASPSDSNKQIAQYAIASRLSFMLIGAPPDQALFKLAAEGKLREPGVLDAQVDRLLDDPRSEAFFQPFVTQWLEIGQPITLVMSHFSKQDFRFGRYLKDSMRNETVAYIKQLFADNRPAKELIVSDWTMMNNSLAYHYGYEGIEGGHLRKVTLHQDDPRGGGILGHAGIQSMLCWMGDNWVIYRGAWGLRHILDDPPPTPPLEVPELDAVQGKSQRELLKKHQADARCAVCHKNIDPLGFAFQNFDLSGRWRNVEHEKYSRNELDGKIAWRGVGKTRPVDTLGGLPRGETFKSFAECKQLISTNYLPDMVRGVMKNLVIYGAGRRPNVHDLTHIRSIMKAHEAKGYPLRDMLKSFVRSKVFLGYDQSR